MNAIFVALFAYSISLQSSPIRNMHTVRRFELMPFYKDTLHSTDDRPIIHWAQGYYHPHAHSHK